MVLSKRERYIAAATLIAVTILALDRLVLTPIEARRTAIEDERQRVVADLEDAGVLFARQKLLAARWQQMLDAGLKSEPAAAESRVLRAISNWAQEAGLTLSSRRPENLSQNGPFSEITFLVAGTGRMSAVAGFLWRLESSPLPARVTELQLGARQEGADDLALQLRISALCQAPQSLAKAAVPAPPAVREGSDVE